MLSASITSDFLTALTRSSLSHQSGKVHLSHERPAARGADLEVDVSGPEGMPPEHGEKAADTTRFRDLVGHGFDRLEGVRTVLAGPQAPPQVVGPLAGME